MKISGFTFLRNAVLNGYPFEESIKSVLPIVDEFICVIGSGIDDTRDRVAGIADPKIKIVDTVWNERMQEKGFVYGQQKMIGQFQCTGDWAFYLEGDEVLHEQELTEVQDSMVRNFGRHEVEALYFDFLHFYGTPDQIGIAGYRKAPRIIRNTLRSIAPDGLFWTILEKNKRGRYPVAASAGANIYHYGHCRKIESMKEKLNQIGKYWGGSHSDFKGYGSIDVAELRPFEGTHPMVMKTWLDARAEREFFQDPDYRLTLRDKRNRVRFWIEDVLQIEISKKHFKRIT